MNKTSVTLENLVRVFRLIQRHGPLERKRIAELAGLSWGAVSQYTAALIRAGIVEQRAAPGGKVGKAASELDISPHDHFVVGVDFTQRCVRVLVMDLKGNALRSRVAAVLDGGKAVQIMLDTLDQALSEFRDRRVLAISIAAQGSTDEEKGVALYLTFDPSWRDLNLREIVEARFGIQTFVFHDPDCVLAAERLFGAWGDERRNVLVVNINYGIGLSMLCGNQIYASTRRRSGELGHVTAIAGGEPCSCGKRGCLEAYASKTGILNRYIDAVNSGGEFQGALGDAFAVSYEAVRGRAEAGDALSLRLFSEAGELLGQALASLACVFDPDSIILYGEFINDRQLYIRALEDRFERELFPGCETKLRYSALGGSATAQGAAFLALDRILGAFLRQSALGGDD